MLRLFEHSKIPSAFIAESSQDVSQSFAAQKDIDGTLYIWFHFLCKTVSVKGNRIVHQREAMQDSTAIDRLRIRAQDQSQADFTWLKPGFVLKVKKQPSLPRMPIRTRTSSSDATMAPVSVEPSVELLCFGAPESLGDRFRKLARVAICDDILQDPYVLLEVVLEEMYKVLDRTGWDISHIFGDIEKVSYCQRRMELVADKGAGDLGAGNHAWQSKEPAARPLHWSSQSCKTCHVST